MDRYSKVQSSIWASKKFEGLSVLERLLYFYLLTNEHNNSIGLYDLKTGYALCDLGYTEKQFANGLLTLSERLLIAYEGDEKIKTIFIFNFLRFNSFANPNNAKNGAGIADKFKDSFLYNLLYSDLEEYCSQYLELFPNRSETVTEPLPNDSTQIQRQIQRQRTKTNTNTNFCPELETSSTPKIETVIIISLPLVDKTEYPITQNQVDEWQELYPAVDILQELRKMKGWLDSNPKNKKTRLGVSRFVNGWLAREQDRGRVVNKGGGYTQQKTKAEIEDEKWAEMMRKQKEKEARENGKIGYDSSFAEVL